MRLNTRGSLTLPEYLYLPLAVALIFIGILLFIEVVWPLTVAGQLVRPIKIRPPRVQSGIQEHKQHIDEVTKVDDEAPEQEPGYFCEEEWEMYEREKRSKCLYWARRLGYHLFHSPIKLDCQVELAWKPNCEDPRH